MYKHEKFNGDTAERQKIVPRILLCIPLFFGVFIVYHILLSGFFPVDEDNVLIAPSWYTPVGLLISTGVCVLYIKENLKRCKRKKKPISEYTDEDIEPVHQTEYAPYKPLSNTVPGFYRDKDEDFAKYGGVRAELLTVDLMDGHDFEYWCAKLLSSIGFHSVNVTPGSGDHGVDILAEKDGVKYAIQCKRYSHSLGNTPVQEVHAGKAMYACHVGTVITNQHFTEGAKKLAQATGVLLWDREWIESVLNSKDSCKNTEKVYFTKYRDELLPAAVDVILETGQASVSIIQRHLNLGYSRAARIVDEIEENGFIGPFQGSKPRAILITRPEWNRIRKK